MHNALQNTRHTDTDYSRNDSSVQSIFFRSIDQLHCELKNIKNDIKGERNATAKRKEQSDDADLIFKSKEFLFIFAPDRDSTALLPSAQ